LERRRDPVPQRSQQRPQRPGRVPRVQSPVHPARPVRLAQLGEVGREQPQALPQPRPRGWLAGMGRPRPPMCQRLPPQVTEAHSERPLSATPQRPTGWGMTRLTSVLEPPRQRPIRRLPRPVVRRAQAAPRKSPPAAPRHWKRSVNVTAGRSLDSRAALPPLASPGGSAPRRWLLVAPPARGLPLMLLPTGSCYSWQVVGHLPCPMAMLVPRWGRWRRPPQPHWVRRATARER
jgi:hypothetical protein